MTVNLVFSSRLGIWLTIENGEGREKGREEMKEGETKRKKEKRDKERNEWSWEMSDRYRPLLVSPLLVSQTEKDKYRMMSHVSEI